MKKRISNVKYMASPHGESYSHAVHLTMHSSLVTDLQQRLAACKGASVVYCLRSSCSTYSQRYDRISHSTWVFLDPEYVGPTLDRPTSMTRICKISICLCAAVLVPGPELDVLSGQPIEFQGSPSPRNTGKSTTENTKR